MTTPTIHFNTKKDIDFFKELKIRVAHYFKSNNISRYANFKMKFKTIFMLGLYFIPFAFILSGSISSFLIITLLWILMGLGTCGIGLSIMHDANHGSYSKNKNVNNALGFLLNAVGGYHVNWKIQHNVLHHSFTNIEGYDDDINSPTLRFSELQADHKIFKYQAYFAPFLYGMMNIYWVFFKDFVLLNKYHTKNLLAGQGLNYKKALRQIIFNKTWYLLLTLVLPIIIVPLPWWQIVLGYFIMLFLSGLILALVFQPAHVNDKVTFFNTPKGGNIENNWAIHQMKTTTNFANNNWLLSWYIGGLNFQIEHHLFPNVCHIHYKNISKIVKETAKEYGVPYLEHKTFTGALFHHFKWLNTIGGKRDIIKKQLV